MRRFSLWLSAISLTALVSGCAVVDDPYARPTRPYPGYRTVYPEYPVYTAPGPVIYAPPPGVYVRPAVPPGHQPPRAQWRDERQREPRLQERMERRERDERGNQTRGQERDRLRIEAQRAGPPQRVPLPAYLHQREESGGP